MEKKTETGSDKKRTRSLTKRIIDPAQRFQVQSVIGDRKSMANLSSNHPGGILMRPPPLSSPLTAPTGRWWVIISKVLTFWAPNFILRRSNNCFHDKNIIQAWREKVALCLIFATIGIMLAFLTLGLQKVLCSGGGSGNNFSDIVGNASSALLTNPPQGTVKVLGSIYMFPVNASTALLSAHQDSMAQIKSVFGNLAGTDVSLLFPTPNACPAQFNSVIQNCTVEGMNFCHSQSGLEKAKIGEVRYTWGFFSAVSAYPAPALVVYNGFVLNLTNYFSQTPFSFGNAIDRAIVSVVGTDASMAASKNDGLHTALTCLASLYAVGFVDQSTPGCIASEIILYISLVVILGVVMTRFMFAVCFDWFLSWKLGKLLAPSPVPLEEPKEAKQEYHSKTKSSKFSNMLANSFSPQETRNSPTITPSPTAMPPTSAHLIEGRRRSPLGMFNTSENVLVQREMNPQAEVMLREYYTVVLVTCYSEGLDSMKATLDSLAQTTYSDPHKLIFIVADGIITGSGNDMSTPDICLSLMDEVNVGSVFPCSYVAIADGGKRHNMAKVNVGYYHAGTHSVPMVVVTKVGTEAEKSSSKPGNRGKRDGQIILMDFFSKLCFGDRLCELQYDLYYKIKTLTGVDPIRYEIVLMVDADTKVLPESLTRMVACMAQDPMIMGLCGETRIENKSETWVTRIQVFEYYISHHLGKAFESIFGGVTCLPGCFCMYRLKVRRKIDGNIVPILCSPSIIQQYSENIVDTLHKKNLLSLGEDRFLSSLMLRAFPNRKMMFVPKALCRTVVPHTFKMLLSQRRRWINSTIHNLFELVLVRELCGTFCFSMQFVVILELIGTVTLPVAIALTFTLLIVTFTGDIQLIPLILLFCILGLPAILILLTTRKVVYIYWMLIYLLALPVWNFILPVYAFWHFDDFSWGETRKVEGEKKQEDHSKKEGQFDGSLIPLRSVNDWEKLHRTIEQPKAQQ